VFGSSFGVAGCGVGGVDGYGLTNGLERTVIVTTQDLPVVTLVSSVTTSVPELSTRAMLLLGPVGLGVAGLRRSAKSVARGLNGESSCPAYRGLS
jgi:hypothetical protein